MNKTALTILVLLLVTACHNKSAITSNSQNLIQAQSIIKTIQQRILPDKRDHIFDIVIKQNNNTIVLSGATDFKTLLNHITDSLSAQKIPFLNQVQLLPLPQFEHKTGVTRLSVANLRAKPKHSSELVTQTLMGMPLQIYDYKNGFYHVRTPEGYYAWIDAAGIKILTNQSFKQWLLKDKCIVTAQYCKVYTKPNLSAFPVSDAVLNDVFIPLEKEDDFIKIAYPDGRTGFIQTENVMLLDAFNDANNLHTSPNDIITAAKQYLGIPYLWGGTSVKGLDCSGFTKTVFAEFGYLLPRDASQQAKIGQQIPVNKQDFSNLKAGDLLFFGKIKNGKTKVTHVAIHINNGKIIHATGEVKIESLNSNDKDYNSERLNSLLLARRVYKVYPQLFSKIYK